MKKLLGGGLAVAFAAAGTMLLTAPVGAEFEGIPEGTISPNAIYQGQTVTVTGDSCATVNWAVFLESDVIGEEGFDGANGVSAAGGLNISYTAPANLDPGTYSIQVQCVTNGESYILQGSGGFDEDDMPTGDIDFRFDVLGLTQDTTTTTEGAAPPPAPPVAGRPSLTG